VRTTSSNPAPAPVRILLVDDNRYGLLARRSVLEELGYQITAASDPMEAMGPLEKETFDLVITDYKMPHMDGIAFIQHLRARHGDMPIILISGFVEALGLCEANTAADIVIQKSSNELQQLVRAVQRLLKRKTPKKPATAERQPPKAKRQGA
jgi:CheY-like chemotaxis protein